MSRRARRQRSDQTRDAKIARWERRPPPLPTSTSTATRKRGQSPGGIGRRAPPASDLRVYRASSAESVPRFGSWRWMGKTHWCSYSPLITGSFTWRDGFFFLRAESHVMPRQAHETADHRQIPQPFQRTFPQLNRVGDVRIFRQSAVQLRILGIVQHVDHMGAADSRWIVHTCVGKSRNIAQLFSARFGQLFHFRLGAEVQAAGGAGLNTGGFQAHRPAVVALRVLENFARSGAKFRDIERAAGDAVAATDAVRFLKIHYAIGVLHDG